MQQPQAGARVVESQRQVQAARILAWVKVDEVVKSREGLQWPIGGSVRIHRAELQACVIEARSYRAPCWLTGPPSLSDEKPLRELRIRLRHA
jgi:hypothetical protein